ncbi:hypothetical protein CCP3SC15_670001 [Gammaproteobacteria bacterium]
MLQFMERLNHEGDYVALYADIEEGQSWRNQVDKVNRVIINEIKLNACIYLAQEYHPSSMCLEGVEQFGEFLSHWCMELSKPLVLFLDEVDALIGDSLINVLRQLRGGYNKRPRAFPHALCIIGLRDIRDYRIYSDSSQRYIVGGSAFNIKEKSILLDNFTIEQVHGLYAHIRKLPDRVSVRRRWNVSIGTVRDNRG